MNALVAKYIEHNHYGKHLGMTFKIIQAGEVHYELTIRTEHLATPNAAHGGLLASLVDAALGVAGLSAVCEENKVVSTVEYKMNFMSPALLHDKLLAKARVIQRGKRILIINCDVICTNRENKLIATALGTFNAYDAAKAGY